MADENKATESTTDNAEPTQSIVDMSDEQILDLINKYYTEYKGDTLDFGNEADISSEDLVNVVAGMTYLMESGAIPNLPQVFGEFWKLAWTELHARMGTIPTNDPTPPIYDETTDGSTDDTLVEPADYTDVATGEPNPTPDDEPIVTPEPTPASEPEPKEEKEL